KGDMKLSRDLLQEALAGFREVGSKTSVANALENLATTASAQGDLEAARKMLEEAIVIDRERGVKSELAWGLAGLGDIDLAEGKLDDATRGYNDALSIRTEIGEKATIAESQLALATVALEREQSVEAESRIRTARDEFRNEKQVDDEMLADSLLSRALLLQHRYGEAQKEVDAGKVLVPKSQNRVNQLQLGLAAAQLQVVQDRLHEAKGNLAAILAEAKKTGLLEFQFEARLETSKIERRSARNAGDGHLLTLQKEATSKGFLLIANKASKERAAR